METTYRGRENSLSWTAVELLNKAHRDFLAKFFTEKKFVEFKKIRVEWRMRSRAVSWLTSESSLSPSA